MRVCTLLFSLLILFATGCSRMEHPVRPVVAVTTAPLAWAAKALAGDSLNVVTLLPSGADPETYEPSLRTMRDLARSEALFTMNTPGFESAIASSAPSNFPDLPILPLTIGLTPIPGHHHHDEEARHNHEEEPHLCNEGANPKNADPHYLTSPANMKIIVANMAASLSRLHPDRARLYHHRADSLISTIDALDARITTLLTPTQTAIPLHCAEGASPKSFALMHPSLSYFARDYHLTQVPLNDEEREISPREYLSRMKKAGNVDIFVAETTHDPTRAAEAARQLNLPIVTVDLNSENWQAELLKLATAIANAKPAPSNRSSLKTTPHN